MRFSIAVLVVMALWFPPCALAVEVSGDQWGTWTRENSPYNVVGEIRVPPESTLVIQPGVVVNFQGHYKFVVDSSATLLAVGVETDSIHFTANQPATGWHGIRFVYADSNSEISYCRLEYGKATGEPPDNRGGAVFCHSSSPSLSNNTFRDNSSVYGGGVYCELYSNPTISDNAFSSNSAGYGGGICCQHSSPTISHNIISGNSYGYGGGVYCEWYSHPTISHNIISGNSATYGGGGIACKISSSPMIANNTISGNTGVAIWCIDWCYPTIDNSIISRNAGGGVYLYSYSSPTLTNNTISGNSGRGVVCRSRSSPAITNTILWGDTAPEIDVEAGADPTVRYCDVQGGWPGRGNIEADPIFVGPEREDFHLRWRSPCIDAGHPSLPPDPDGTRSDIGAFHFNHDLIGVVEVYPYDTPILIPPEGGEILYDAWVFNLFHYTLTVDIRSYIHLPGTGRSRCLDSYNNISIAVADSLGKIGIRRGVPDYAPPGDYTFVAYIGSYARHQVIDSCYFYFTKTGSVEGAVTDWPEGDEWLKESKLTESNLPGVYAISQNYPNPFNARTVIGYQLPVEGYVKLEVYNLMGENVVTLVDEMQDAGHKSVTWNASKVSSGLYFYKLTAGDFIETRRMMLLK